MVLFRIGKAEWNREESRDRPQYVWECNTWQNGHSNLVGREWIFLVNSGETLGYSSEGK